MQEVTEAMIREIIAEDAREPVTLVTITAAGLDAPIRCCNEPAGIESRGFAFPFFPFSFSGAGASAEEPERACRLEVANIDAVIVEAIRAATDEPVCTVELVRLFDPDNVEIGFRNMRVTDASADGPSVVLTLKGKDLDNMVACSKRYVAARTPGLF